MCLTTKTRIDAESETLIPTIGGGFDVAQPVTESGSVSSTLRTGGNDHADVYNVVAQPIAEYYSHDYCQDRVYSTEGLSPALNCSQHHTFRTAMAVRRLTPVECERLQGFPDNYTNIPWRKSPESPDGPRYKALGNSMAVPVMRWIGERIAKIQTLMEVA